MHNELTEQLIARAQRDDEFRERLQNDPRAAVSEELGVEIPASLRITVVEESSDEVVVVLPSKNAPLEIPADELAAVAGGGWTGECPTIRCPPSAMGAGRVGCGP